MRHLTVLLACLWAAGTGLLGGCGDTKSDEAPRHERATSTVVRVLVDAPGRRVEEVEREIVAPVEARFARLDGLLSVQSTSRANHAELTLRFTPGRDVEETLGSVRAARDGVAADLSDATWQITLDEATDETLTYVVTGNAPSADVSSAARRLREQLAPMPGVRRVALIGATTPAVVVGLDVTRCAAYGVAPDTVVAALQDALGAGVAEALEEIVLQEGAGATTITLRDVAEIREEALADGSQARCWGLPVVLVRVHATRAARPDVARKVEVWSSGLRPPLRVESRIVEAGHAVLQVTWQGLPGESARAAAPTLDRLGTTLGARGGDGALVWLTAEGGDPRGGASVSLDPAHAAALVEKLGRGVVGASIQRVDLVSQGAQPPLVVRIMADDPAILARTTTQVRLAVSPVEGVTAVFHESTPSVPTLHVDVSDERAKALGTTQEAIESQIALALEGQHLASRGDVTVIVRAERSARTAADLGAMHIWADGRLVPLSAVAEITLVRAPTYIRHVDGRRALTLRASVKPSALRDKVLQAAKTAVERLSLPPEVTVRWEASWD